MSKISQLEKEYDRIEKQLKRLEKERDNGDQKYDQMIEEYSLLEHVMFNDHAPAGFYLDWSSDIRALSGEREERYQQVFDCLSYQIILNRQLIEEYSKEL